jgi:hypothetical protein
MRARTGDIAVSDGKILEVGVIHRGAERRIDARGLVVAPDFIDSHSDLMLIAEPEARAHYYVSRWCECHFLPRARCVHQTPTILYRTGRAHIRL